MHRSVCLPTIMGGLGPLISATPGLCCDEPQFTDEIGPLISGSTVGQTAVVESIKAIDLNVQILKVK